MFPQKQYTLSGFEPGSSVLKADAMATAPRRHGAPGQITQFIKTDALWQNYGI
jgi:hypothetical protein